MSVLELLTRGTVLALLISAPAGALSPTLARADTKSTPAQLALISTPATSAVVLVDAPRPPSGDAPAPATSEAHTSWWPWVLIAAGVAGVAAVVLISSGGDPACPPGRY